jgi:DNA-directed RNA polymerase alpha subunit
MSHDAWRVCKGSIPGLLLPQHAWNVLEDANITTVGQLREIADRLERLIPGVGPKTAEAIRAELARVSVADEEPPARARRPLRNGWQ